jgi:hypothetical protein
MKFLTKITTLICISFFFSCSSDTPSSVTPEDNQVKDDFSYLSVNASGKIEKIGNNTGKISPYSNFEGLNQSNFINLNTIASNSEKIFVINHIPPTDKLYIFDRKTKTTTSKVLVYPKEIIGEEPSMTSFTWDESKKTLYGIIVNNLLINSTDHLCYFVKIDPNTLEVSYQGINFKQTASYTTFLNNDNLYSSYNNDNTFEIDLANNNSKTVFFNNSKISFTKAITYKDNTAYCLRYKSSGGLALTKINLSDYSYEDLLANESFGTANPTGKGFINTTNNEYVCCITKDSQYCLLKYNILTKKYTTLKPTSDSSIDANMLIIDKIEN